MLKVVTVCGLGVGSSLIMKMTVNSALKNLGVKAKVEHWDMGTVRSQNADLIVTTKEFEKKLKDFEHVVVLNNVMDENEAKEKLANYLDVVQ